MRATALAGSLATLARPFWDPPLRSVRAIRARLRRRADIRHLHDMSERSLRDIGLGRGEIERAVRLGRP